METIVDILGLAIKIDTILTNGVLIEMLDESKIDEVKFEVSKTKVDKIGEHTMDVLITEEVKIVGATISMTNNTNLTAEERVCSLVDEAEITSIFDTLSYERVKSDWTFYVSIVVTTKLDEVVSTLDVVIILLGA